MDSGHIIVLGYGDVSKSVVEVFQDKKINFIDIPFQRNGRVPTAER